MFANMKSEFVNYWLINYELKSDENKMKMMLWNESGSIFVHIGLIVPSNKIAG